MERHKKWKSLDTGWLSKSEMVDVQDSSGRDGKGRIDKKDAFLMLFRIASSKNITVAGI